MSKVQILPPETSRVDVRRVSSAETLAPQKAPAIQLPPELTQGFEREARLSMRMTKSLQQQARQAMTEFAQNFSDLADNKSKFHALLKQVYGSDYDSTAAEALRQRALRGDFTWLPPVRYIDSTTLGGANGAYNHEDNVIYLNSNLLADPKRAAQVYSEEIGHFVDFKLKGKDSAGDEGELFRRLLAGEKLSAAELASVRSENDRGSIVVDGRTVEVEFWHPLRTIGNAIRNVGNAVVDIVQNVGNAVVDTVQNVGHAVGNGVRTVGRAVGRVLKRVVEGTRTAAEGVKDTLHGIFHDLKDGALSVGRGIGQILHGDFTGGARSIGKGLFTALLEMPANATLMSVASGIRSVQTLFGLEPVGRELTADEIAFLRTVYGDSIDYSQVTVKEGNAGLFSLSDRAFGLGNTLYAKGSDVDEDLLVHEMAHVWQFQNGGSDYMLEALVSQQWGKGYDWQRSVPNTPWRDLEPEQQAQLLEDAYAYGTFTPGDPNYHTFCYDTNGDGEVEDLTVYLEETMHQVRSGQGAP